MVSIEPEEPGKLEKPTPVKSDKEVIESVSAFNEGLKGEEELQNHLSYFRAWYYIPELDKVGPSKFIGYKNLPVAQYLTGENLDGKVTELILGKWFNLLIEGTPEANYVESLVEQLVSSYDKVMNRKARFNAPRGWRLGREGVASVQNATHIDPPTSDLQPSVASLRDAIQIDPQLSDLQPLVQVFWRAFLDLSQEDQDTIAKLIIAHGKR